MDWFIAFVVIGEAGLVLWAIHGWEDALQKAQHLRNIMRKPHCVDAYNLGRDARKYGWSKDVVEAKMQALREKYGVAEKGDDDEPGTQIGFPI